MVVCLQDGYQKDVMCSNEIELHAEDIMISILSSMANTIGVGGLYDPFNKYKSPPVGNKLNKTIIQAPENMRKVAKASIWDLPPVSY